MTEYAVAAMNFWDNELTIETTKADNWKDALRQHVVFKIEDDENGLDWLSNDLETAKGESMEADILFDIVVIGE